MKKVKLKVLKSRRKRLSEKKPKKLTWPRGQRPRTASDQKKIKKISQPNDALLSAKRHEKEKKEGIEGKKKKRDLQNENFTSVSQTLLWKVITYNNNNKHGA
jgi:hypothetical protein